MTGKLFPVFNFPEILNGRKIAKSGNRTKSIFTIPVFNSGLELNRKNRIKPDPVFRRASARRGIFLRVSYGFHN